ncbi:hypothetical protein AX16_003700 [Volvariella volvacea WC 439]|nr:hypothetical protein AX16_003700 [Volvariella volvacea WC 439]
MDYFSKFLRTGSQPAPKPQTDHALEFHKSWTYIKNTLLYPDERQLNKGIKSTDVPRHLQSMVDALVWESDRTEEGGTGACLEYLLKNDVLGTLVRLSENDRPAGIQAEVLRSVQMMVLLLDEQFLVHSAVHRAVLRLLRNCVGDDLQEQLDNRSKVMGAAKNSPRTQPSEYEEDLVNLLCILCSRIKTYRELLMIFFHDKHWYRSEPLFAVEEEEEEEEEQDEDISDEPTETTPENEASARQPSPTPSQTTITPTPQSPPAKKPEYEFLLFNYLLRFVHREGKIGDFARAGLLFLMDVAMSPQETGQRSEEASLSEQPPPDPVTDAALALAEYILDGDFSDVLGAGLGAVYSLLPSKLKFSLPKADPVSGGNGMIIGGKGSETEEDLERQELEQERALALGIEDASNPDLVSRTEHFLKLLEFLQDVFRRNLMHESVDASALVGNAIVQSILDAVRRTFLENVLYPSVLECSDMDGSAVAVMSYIDLMIRALQDGPLADLLVEFLISEDNEDVQPRQRAFSMLTLGKKPPSSSADRQAKSRRRKSSAMVLLEMENPDTQKPSEYFTSVGRFTLKDLIVANLRSKSQQTATSALQLLQTLLFHHPKLSIDRLLVVIHDQNATGFPHPALASFPSLISRTQVESDGDDDSFNYPGNEKQTTDQKTTPLFLQPETTYLTHEREMNLYLALVSRVDPLHNGEAFSTGYDHYLCDALFAIQNQPAFLLTPEDYTNPELRQSTKHKLNPGDRILSSLLESLRRFFSNTPEFNMALTGVLATLAIHPDRSLAGWLTFSTNGTTPIVTAGNEERDDFLDEDGDDRSIDYHIEERLHSPNQPSNLPASSLDALSRPAVHTIFHGLVTQLERYRQIVDNFDKYLLERRQGLLFSENLTDALSLALEVTEEPGPLQPTESAPPQRPKPKSRPSAASSIVSFLTPRKSKQAKPSPSEPSTPPKHNLSKSVSASPFGPHYQHTNSVTVEPYMAPSTDPWDPAKSTRWTADEEDVFSSGWSDRRGSVADSEQPSRPTQITLSQLLDNVVILEESIKELVAIIHARRCLGIDSLRYL